jgi:hypothetical protein
MRPGRSIRRHAMRGLGRLPHVGENPGVPIAIILLGIGSAVGAERAGLPGALAGLVFSACLVLPTLLVSSVSRSRLSDRLTSEMRR